VTMMFTQRARKSSAPSLKLFCVHLRTFPEFALLLAGAPHTVRLQQRGSGPQH
jgi:hypothetical protein